MAQAPSSYKPYASLADIMAGISLPKSNSVFDVTKHTPKDDMEWIAVRNRRCGFGRSGKLHSDTGRL